MWFKVGDVGDESKQWSTINSPDVWWVQGDGSSSSAAVASSSAGAGAGAGGWLKVYGRSIAFEPNVCSSDLSTSAKSTITLTPTAVHAAAAAAAAAVARDLGRDAGASARALVGAGGGPISLVSSSASCYGATFAIPAGMPAGEYKATITNGVAGGVAVASNHVGEALAVTIVRAAQWPPTVFPVPAGAGGDAVVAAVAKAGAAGGGVVMVPAGSYDMGNVSVHLGDGVQLVGTRSAHGGTSLLTELRWTQPTTAPLLMNAPTSGAAGVGAGGGAAGSRYKVQDLAITVAAPSKSYVLDIAGHGVEVSGVKVAMDHSLTSAASVVHTHGTGFSIVRSNITHDQLTCTSPG
jgi:hypothetical protein